MSVVGRVGDPLVVLVHGFGADQQVWTPVLRDLTVRVRVATMDLAGHGRARAGYLDAQRHATLEGHARDVLEVVEALDEGPAVVLGHSASGMAGLHAARMAPDRIAGLVLLASSPYHVDDPPDWHGGLTGEDVAALLDDLDTDLAAAAGRMAHVLLDADAEIDITDRVVRGITMTAPAAASLFARAAFLTDSRDLVPTTTHPTAVLAPRDDLLVPASVSRWLADQLPAGMLITLGAAGHTPHLTAPATTASAIDTALRRLLAPEPTWA